MFQLNKLTKTVAKKKRIGRGGSRGGTSGRGHKGQGSRSGGNVSFAFEGGQMPISRRLPKRGFNNTRFQKKRVVISLTQLSAMFDDGAEVTKEAIMKNGLAPHKRPFVVKILANGELEKKLTVPADFCSKKALEMIKKAGGEIKLTEGV
ncbi:50S ribosomal protein L15 [bacterium]|jgi:large subunit ribosomal protein L15|nr:50S ribosomal protein L15 [bacterium]